MALTAYETQARQNRIHRAVSRAIEQAEAGNVPTLLSHVDSGLETRQRWAVNSRSTAGVVYLVDLVAGSDGVETRCSCAAAHAERVCFHRALVRGAALGEFAYIDGRHVAAVIAAPDRSGQPA